MKNYLIEMKKSLLQTCCMDAFLSYQVDYNQMMNENQKVGSKSSAQKSFYRPYSNPYTRKDKRNKEWEVPLN